MCVCIRVSAVSLSGLYNSIKLRNKSSLLCQQNRIKVYLKKYTEREIKVKSYSFLFFWVFKS